MVDIAGGGGSIVSSSCYNRSFQVKLVKCSVVKCCVVTEFIKENLYRKGLTFWKYKPMGISIVPFSENVVLIWKV